MTKYNPCFVTKIVSHYVYVPALDIQIEVAIISVYIKNNDNSFQLETIEGVYVDDFDLDTLVNFINHASGRKFNSELLDYCQNSINFRTD